MSKYSGVILVGDVSDSIDDVRSKYDLLNTEYGTLTRCFLDFFLEDDCLTLPFDQLKAKYIERFEINEEELQETGNTESDFYKEIVESYFNIIPNEPHKLKQLVQMVIEDLKKIESDKDLYINKLEELKNKSFEDGKNYEEKLLIHFINKLKKAEEEILDYIKNDLRKAANKSRYKKLIWLKFMSDLTYSYNYAPRKYKIESVSEISNKLGEIQLRRYYELKELYRTDKDIFLKELQRDFDLDETINSIKDYIVRNRRLSERKELLEDILDLKSSGKAQLFCNVVPQQIEGILYDYCVEFGIEESSLINSTLGDKINLLKENDNDVIDYEYFAFKFPVIRNRVAHGKLITQDLDLNSWLLLLDLKYVCRLLLSPDLECNRKVAIVNKLDQNSNLLELLEVAIVMKSGIEGFYEDARSRLENLKEIVRSKLLDSEFPYESINMDNKKEVLHSLRILKKVGINDRECKIIIDKVQAFQDND